MTHGDGNLYEPYGLTIHMVLMDYQPVCLLAQIQVTGKKTNLRTMEEEVNRGNFGTFIKVLGV